MSSDSAQPLLLAIIAVTAIVWMIGLQFLLVSARKRNTDDPENSLTEELLRQETVLGQSQSS